VNQIWLLYGHVTKGVIYTYVKNPDLYICPSDRRGREKKLSYSMNAVASYIPEPVVERPAEFVQLVDEGETLNDGYFWALAGDQFVDCPSIKHNGGANFPTSPSAGEMALRNSWARCKATAIAKPKAPLPTGGSWLAGQLEDLYRAPFGGRRVKGCKTSVRYLALMPAVPTMSLLTGRSSLAWLLTIGVGFRTRFAGRTAHYRISARCLGALTAPPSLFLPMGAWWLGRLITPKVRRARFAGRTM
jgi:hypothetical protein